MSSELASRMSVPVPRDDQLGADEDPITQLDLEELGLLTPGGEQEE